MTPAARVALPVVLLLGAVAGAQTPRFPADADVVGVDVSVVDGDGKPVRDLTAADFEVEVDGRPRRVLSANFVDFEVRAAGAPPAVRAPGAAGAPAAVPEAATWRRLIVFVVDRGELSAGGIHRTVSATRGLLDRLGPKDLVGVLSLPSGPRLDFTSDRRAVARVLGKIGPGRDDGLSHALPMRERLESTMRSALDRLDALESLLEQLARIPGPKAVVLISGGMTAVGVPFEGGDPGAAGFGLSGLPTTETVERLRRVVTAAAASRTTFFSLFVSQRGREGIAEKSYFTTLDPLADPQFRATTLDTLSAMSGGTQLEIVAGADRAIARLADEMSGQYLLGLDPAEGDRDGKPHEIRVEVQRPGVTVRARRQFVIGAEPQRAAPLPPAVRTVSTEVRAPAPAGAQATEPASTTAAPPGATGRDHVRRLEDARRSASEGDRLLAGESFEDAAKSYADAIALEPMYFMAYYGLGRARMGQKDYPAAIAAFEQARRVFEERTEVVRGRRAARDAERAARSAGSRAVGSTSGASGTSAGGPTPDLGPRADPVTAVGEPLPVVPPGLTLALGSAYFRSGRIADAEREYRAALAAEPKLGEARINLAVVLLMTGRAVDAREQIALAKSSGAKVPAGLEQDVDAALAASR